jgi:hypothetical protein
VWDDRWIAGGARFVCSLWGWGMLLAIRRHLSYANVVATLALVFAMGGSAIAAKHYLITSTGQISPRVLKKLEARLAHNLKPGAAGKEGAVGKEGLSLLSRAEQETLRTMLPFMRYVASGVGGKPTIQFSGANVQIVNGAGGVTTTNGLGNLVVGYDEQPGVQTGSHNLILGYGQTFTSYGGMLGGAHNTISAPEASVLSGTTSAATAQGATVIGGGANEATAPGATVSGGAFNAATGPQSSVSGGNANEAAGGYDSVSGGSHNRAGGTWDAILGGSSQALASNSKCGTIPAGGATC